MKNIIAKHRAKKTAIRVASELQRELQHRLYAFTKHLDADAQGTIYDLTSRLGPLKHMDQPIDPDLRDLVGFMGDNCGVIFGGIDSAKREEIELDVEKLAKKQFATFAENALYTHGTQGLLELLTRYHRVKTPTATITTVPDARTFMESRAVINAKDLKEEGVYDDTRAVYVSIVFDTGFIMFGFEEKVKP